MSDDDELDRVVERAAHEHGFSGAVRIDRTGRTLVSASFGLADRRHGVPNTPATRFGIASGTKGFTALVAMSLIDDGVLSLETTARSLLGADLPLIDDGVTVHQLLAHRSGIGDYLDESAIGDIDDHVMPVPVHRLSTTEAYLGVLDGHPQREPPGESFRYNNGGFVVLALLAERAAGSTFDRLVDDRVCGPAGLVSTGFVRGDELPADAAVGYLEGGGLRTNVLHLPVVGSGDGGIFSSADDIARLWRAWSGGDIVPVELRDMMWRPRSVVPDERMRYGLGCWVHATTPTVSLVGMDAGVSFRSVHDPERDITHTVLANTSSGAWPITKAIDEALGLGGIPSEP